MIKAIHEAAYTFRVGKTTRVLPCLAIFCRRANRLEGDKSSACRFSGKLGERASERNGVGVGCLVVAVLGRNANARGWRWSSRCWLPTRLGGGALVLAAAGSVLHMWVSGCGH